MFKRLAAMVVAVAFLVCVPYTFFPENPNWYRLDMTAKKGGKVVGGKKAHAAETDFGNAKGFGWQERARMCVALTSEQCTRVVELQTGAGDGGAGAASGDAGTGAGAAGGSGGTGGSGSSGGSGGNGCSR